MADSRLFPIVGEPARLFYAGSLPGGRQALISLLSGEIVMAVFGSEGDLLEFTRHELPSLPVVTAYDDYREVTEEEEFEEYLREQFGFSPAMIRVKEFQHSDGELAVYHRPKMYQEFLRNPTASQFDDDDRLGLPTVISEWDESGQFVLEVGACDFWLDQTGEVVAS